jgi:hypothetical protein
MIVVLFDIGIDHGAIQVRCRDDTLLPEKSLQRWLSAENCTDIHTFENITIMFYNPLFSNVLVI